MSAAFDTFQLARTLRDKAEFSLEQAKAMADAIADAMQSDLVTTADLKAEMQGVRANLRETELRLEAKIEATKAELLKWLATGMVALQAVILLSVVLTVSRAFAR